MNRYSNIKPSLDELYRNRPDARRQMNWPIINSVGKVLEWHSDYWSAADACKGENDRFIGEPRYADELRNRKGWVL